MLQLHVNALDPQALSKAAKRFNAPLGSVSGWSKSERLSIQFVPLITLPNGTLPPLVQTFLANLRERALERPTQ